MCTWASICLDSGANESEDADGHFLFLTKPELLKVLSQIKGPDPIEEVSSKVFAQGVDVVSDLISP